MSKKPVLGIVGDLPKPFTLNEKDRFMPNWVNNTLKIIKGDPTEVFEFVRTEQSVFDFNKLVAMPEDIKNSDENFVRDGLEVPAWYSWAVENWGTKWNACDATYSANNPESVIWFDTAWSPPVPVFELLAKQFPAHEIVIHSDECEIGFHRTFTLRDGEIAWAGEICHCFDEDSSPLSAEEMDALGIEEAP